ncbi:MAG: MFS transporter [Pseudomonadota bacterium]
MTQGRLSSGRLTAFVSPEAPFSAFLMTVVVFVPPFYAGTVGLGLSTVGLIYGLTKLWDVVTDPVFGIVSDRLRTPWGRRMPWLVLSVPLLCLCTYMTFVPSKSVGGAYFTIWMLLLYIGWTIGSVSHVSWAAELSTEYHERSRISAYKQAAAQIGGLSLILIVAVFENVTEADERGRMALIALVLMIALPVTVFAATRAVKEPPIPKIDQAETRSLRTLPVLLKNKPLRLLLLATLLIGIAAGSSAGMLLFYVERVLKLGPWAAFAIGPTLLSGLLFLPVCAWLSRRLGKHRTLCYVLFYHLFASLLFLVIPPGNLLLTCGAFLLLGANQAVGVFIPRAIMADVADIETAESGVQQTGLYMSLLQTASKIAAALAIGLSYPVLSLVGFDPSPEAVNTEQALLGLRIMIVAFPGIAFILIILTMWNFPLNEAAQLKLRDQVDRQTATGS